MALLRLVGFLVLKLSTKMDIPWKGRIYLYSPQFLPLLGWEEQEYLSLSGIDMSYHTPCCPELCSPNKEDGCTATQGEQIAAQPPSLPVERISYLLVEWYLVSIPSSLGTPTLPCLSFMGWLAGTHPATNKNSHPYVEIRESTLHIHTFPTVGYKIDTDDVFYIIVLQFTTP